jgi:hypothetical protein
MNLYNKATMSIGMDMYLFMHFDKASWFCMIGNLFACLDTFVLQVSFLL